MPNTSPQANPILQSAAAEQGLNTRALNSVEGVSIPSATVTPPRIQYSLAQWSLHCGFQNNKYKPVEFASITKNQFGLNGIEYVNQFYADTLSSKLTEQLHQQAKDEGIKNPLIMVDNEGTIGNPDAKARKQSVLNHHKWADAAHLLENTGITTN